MPDLPNIQPPARRAMTIFYILDVSGSMAGQKISVLNRAMEETIDSLKEVARSSADAKLKIAVLKFSSGCEWVNANGPEDMEDFLWTDLTAGGLTDAGETLKELNSKLSRNAFLQSMTGNYIPIIIFMTDGQPTDDYKRELEKIRENKWFTRATKIGLAIGDDADMDMIADIVGNSEAVVKPNDLDTFARLIKFVSVTSSMTNSQTQNAGADMSGRGVIEDAINNGIIDRGEVGGDLGTMEPEAVAPIDVNGYDDPDTGWDD